MSLITRQTAVQLKGGLPAPMGQLGDTSDSTPCGKGTIRPKSGQKHWVFETVTVLCLNGAYTLSPTVDNRGQP